MLIAPSHLMAKDANRINVADEPIKTGISAGDGGEMGDDGHVAPGGELASMPGGPTQSHDQSQNDKPQKKATEKTQEKGSAPGNSV
ncbi:MAG: hypothetical protein ACJ763_10220 [Bdellovibrionia bacterium]